MANTKKFSWKLFLSVAGASILFVILGQILINYIFGFIEMNNFNSAVSGFTVLIFELIFLALVSFAIMKTKKISYFQSLEFLGFVKPNRYQLAIGLICLIPLILCYYLAFKQSLATGYQPCIRSDWLMTVMLAFFQAGICEEGLNRGFFFHYLRQKYSFVFSATLTGIIWCFSHVNYLFSSWGGGIPADQKIFYFLKLIFLIFLLSFPSAYVFERTGNAIWGWLIVHVAYDSQTILGFSGRGVTIDVLQMSYSEIGLVSSGLIAFPVTYWLLKNNRQKRSEKSDA